MISYIKTLLFVFLIIMTPFSHAFNGVDIDTKLKQVLAEKDLNVAMNVVTSLLESSQLSPKQRFSTFMAKARLHHKLGELDNAITILITAKGYAEQHKLTEQAAQSNKTLGIMYYYKRENRQALTAYNLALDYVKVTKQSLKQAHLLNNIALVHAAMGNVEVSLSRYLEAQTIYDEIGSEADKTDVRFNIAGLYNRLGRYDLAITMYEYVIAARLTRDNVYGVAVAYGDLGIAYYKAGQYEKARDLYVKSLTYFQQENLNYELAVQLENLAEVFYSMGLIDESITYARRGIEIARQTNNQPALISGLYSLAIGLFSQGEFNEARKHLSLSTEIALNSEDAAQLVMNKQLMSLILSAQSNISLALESLSDYQLASQQLEKKTLATRLTQYQAQLESKHLQQKLETLLQRERLQTYKLKNTQQQYAFGVSILVMFIIIAFYMYRTRNERNLKIRLAKKVKQRTQALELLMENLRQSNDVKNQFLTNMSHEIRTPLTAVIGQAEAIMAGDVEARYVHQEVEIIYNNSNHLLTLLNDILDLSRIEANKLELDLQPYDINKLISDVYNIFYKQARKKNLVFTVVNQLHSSYVLDIDSLRLKQILINLCSNAIKFTHQGHVTLRVSCDYKHLTFAIEDTGIGMSSGQIKQIFTRFTQADNSISRRFGGSGLGLCLSQQLALMMDGNIHVESNLSQGSRFSFALPVSKSQCENAYLAIPETITENVENIESLTGTVLLADDHDDNRRLMKRLLEVLGLQVVTAVNGLEVIEQYKHNNFQLILLDIQMPELDGVQTLEILQQQEVTIPIIALTANAMSHEIEHYLSLGFDDYVSKPIERPQFIKLLAHHLKQTQNSLPESSLDHVSSDDLKEKFEASFSKEVTSLKALLADNDYQGISACAHRLSGAAAMFGYGILAELAAEVESEVKLENHSQVQILTKRLIRLLALEKQYEV